MDGREWAAENGDRYELGERSIHDCGADGGGSRCLHGVVPCLVGAKMASLARRARSSFSSHGTNSQWPERLARSDRKCSGLSRNRGLCLARLVRLLLRLGCTLRLSYGNRDSCNLLTQAAVNRGS